MTSKMTGHIRQAVDNVYQPEPASLNVTSSLEELEEPSLRRISNISVSSGIYEEILDDFVPMTKTRTVPSNLYEDPGELILNSSMKLKPPPLPPRQRCGSGSTRHERLVYLYLYVLLFDKAWNCSKMNLNEGWKDHDLKKYLIFWFKSDFLN